MEDSACLTHTARGQDDCAPFDLVERLGFIHIFCEMNSCSIGMRLRPGSEGLRLGIEQRKVPIGDLGGGRCHGGIDKNREKWESFLTNQIKQDCNNLLGSTDRERRHDYITTLLEGSRHNFNKFIFCALE